MRRLTLEPGATYRNDSSMQVVITVHEFGDDIGALPPGKVVEVPNAFWAPSRNPAELIRAEEVANAYRMYVTDGTDQPDYIMFAPRINPATWWLPAARAQESIPNHDEQRDRENHPENWQDSILAARRRDNALLAALAQMRDPEPTYDPKSKRRARVLLLRHLNKEQRTQFKTNNAFAVTGGSSGDLYFVGSRVIRDRDNHEFCLQVVGESVPPEDAMLARKILIESNEELFLETANDLTAPQPNPQWGTRYGRYGDQLITEEQYDAIRREQDREARIAERQRFHAEQQAIYQVFTAPPLADQSFTTRLRNLVARARG